FVHARQGGNLLAKGLLHDGTGERKEDGSVRRLNENVRADALDALAPFVYDAGRESYDHQDENHLDGNGGDAEDGAERARGEISENHAERRKLCAVDVSHCKLSKENCITCIFCRSKGNRKFGGGE